MTINTLKCTALPLVLPYRWECYYLYSTSSKRKLRLSAKIPVHLRSIMLKTASAGTGGAQLRSKLLSKNEKEVLIWHREINNRIKKSNKGIALGDSIFYNNAC